ncbi:MAG: carbamoyltransferase HypF, partial [Inquilinus sp.]|nr:carbamoyltransferase HypF [Inquilinus sp.]
MELVVQGTVQGVGFRPFVHRLATTECLSGWVRNAADGVHIGIFGTAASIARFQDRLASETPPLARIDGIREGPLSGDPPDCFRIIASAPGDARTAVTADAAMCADCRRELFDPADRRYGYPFLNCTHCG